MVLYHLKKYSPKSPKYIEAKNNLVKNVEKFYEGRNKIIKGFKNNIFQVYSMKHRKKDQNQNQMQNLCLKVKK